MLGPAVKTINDVGIDKVFDATVGVKTTGIDAWVVDAAGAQDAEDNEAFDVKAIDVKTFDVKRLTLIRSMLCLQLKSAGANLSVNLEHLPLCFPIDGGQA